VSGETDRLAMLEATLVGAAAVQAGRRRRRRRRRVILAAVVAPLVLVAAGSVARTGTFRGVDHNLSVLRDDRLASPDGSAARIAGSVGARPRDRESERSWRVGTQRVIGYTTPSGTFCYRFVTLGAGCLSRATLTHAQPLNPTVDHLNGRIRIYGFATDDVTGVSVQAPGLTRRAAMGRNAFYLQMNSLGGGRGFTLTLRAHLRDGGIRRMRVWVAAMDTPLPQALPPLPGALTPVEDTAA
jgi:hypothetical protein